MNLERAQLRQAHNVLSALMASKTEIGPEWFHATSETPDEAQDEYERFKWRSGS